MPDLPVDLDKYRGANAQKATEARCHDIVEFLARTHALKEQQQELERSYLKSSASTWPEVGARALYLLEVFAAESGALSGTRKKLLVQTRDALTRLYAAEEKKS